MQYHNHPTRLPNPLCLNTVPDGPVQGLTTTNQDDYNIPQLDNVNDQSYKFSLGIINCCSVCNK